MDAASLPDTEVGRRAEADALRPDAQQHRAACFEPATGAHQAQRRFHRDAQVHVHRHRTDYPSGVMHQQHQLEEGPPSLQGVEKFFRGRDDVAPTHSMLTIPGEIKDETQLEG